MLKVEQLKVNFGKTIAVNSLSFSLNKGESLGIIGESGSGKTTLARTIMKLIPKKFIHKESQIYYENKSVISLPKKNEKNYRRKVQMVFQDPFSSFNPRIKVGKAIEEGLRIHNIGTDMERENAVLQILKDVGLTEDAYHKYPHEFSGGQRQRIALARAIILKPNLIIADEPVSALDVSVQAQILNLMLKLKKEYDLTYVLIAHDLGIVDYFCDRILVMYKGAIVEEGGREILKNPKHEYTIKLLQSLPEKLVI